MKKFCLTALASAVGITVFMIAKCRKDTNEEKIRQAEEYNSAIYEILTGEDLCDFNNFAAALNKKYGITAKCTDGETVEYSSDKYSSVITSKDHIRTHIGSEIRLESMSELNDFFLPL